MIVKFALFEVDDPSIFSRSVTADGRYFPCGYVFRRRGVMWSHSIPAAGLESRSSPFVGLWNMGPWDIKGGSHTFAGTSLLAFV